MSVFEINSDEVTFLESELTNLIAKLKQFQYIQFVKKELHELKLFQRDVIENKRFNEETYFSIVRRILLVLKEHMERDSVCILILDFSRIHSSIDDIYEELHLSKRLMQFVFNVGYSGNEYNRGMLQDYMYSSYYPKAINVLDSDGFDTFVKFLKEDKFLSNSEDGCWIIMSIFSNLVNGKAFSKTELECLVKEFDESLTKRVRKELLVM